MLSWEFRDNFQPLVDPPGCVPESGGIALAIISALAILGFGAFSQCRRAAARA